MAMASPARDGSKYEGYVKKHVVKLRAKKDHAVISLPEEQRAFYYGKPWGSSRAFRVDDLGHVYLLFGLWREVRKYDVDGKFIKSYRWTEETRRGAWRLQLDEAGNIYVLNTDYYLGKNIRQIQPNGKIKTITLDKHISANKLVISNGRVYTKKGKIIKEFGKVRNDENSRRRLNKWAAKITHDAVPFRQPCSKYFLKSGNVTANISSLAISDKIIRAEMAGLDGEGNYFITFYAPDPTIEIGYPRGRKVMGEKAWVAKFDSEGKLLGWIKCEAIGLRAHIEITSGGDIYQFWADNKVYYVTKWYTP